MIGIRKNKDFLSHFENQEFIPVIMPVVFTNGLGQVRALGKKGIKSLAVSPDPKDLTFYSRYPFCYHIANPWENEGLFMDELLQIGTKLRGRGILFLSAPELYLPMLWKYKEEIEKTFILPFNMETIFRLEDKENQINAAKQAGLHVSPTIFLKSGDVVEISVDRIGTLTNIVA